MVDVQQFQPVDARLVQLFEIFRRHFVARLDIDFAGRLVDEVIGAVAAIEFLGLDQQGFQAVLLRLVDRKSVVKGKSVSVRGGRGGRRISKIKKNNNSHTNRKYLEQKQV